MIQSLKQPFARLGRTLEHASLAATALMHMAIAIFDEKCNPIPNTVSNMFLGRPKSYIRGRSAYIGGNFGEISRNGDLYTEA